MGTLSTYCEQLPAAAHQQNLLVARMTDEHTAVGELIESDTLTKVWTGELGLFLRHLGLPSRSGIASFTCARPGAVGFVRPSLAPAIMEFRSTPLPIC